MSGPQENGHKLKDMDDPQFLDDRSFIWDRQGRFPNIFALSASFASTLELRGAKIHRYLKDEANRSNSLCLLARFPSGADRKLLLLALLPRKKILLVENTLEHYFLVQSVEEAANASVCSTGALNTQLGSDYPSESRSYIFSKVCGNCLGNVTSDSLRIYEASSGTRVGTLSVEDIRFRFLSQNTQGSGAPSCSGTTQCRALNQGYDCCLERQCVRDRSVRYGVDQNSQAFLSSVQDIASNPNHIFQYPQFYYLCPGEPPSSGDDNGGPPGSVEEKKDRLLTLKQLHECTSPSENEEGHCTVTYERAGPSIANGQTFQTLRDDRDFTGIWSGPASDSDDYATLGSILEVTYAGEILYDKKHYRCMRDGFECYYKGACTSSASRCPIKRVPFPGGSCRFDPGAGAFGVSSNDNIVDAQCIVVKPDFASPQNAPHDRLEITYRVDGSCERVNSLIARCKKHYVQGQFDRLDMKVNDHSPGSQVFRVPSYADVSKNFMIFVDGLQVFEGNDWSRSGRNITFSTRIYDGQRVRIEYFVDIRGGDEILTSQDAATEKINDFCSCQDNMSCRLKPVKEVKNGVEQVVDYSCVYPKIFTGNPPMEQIVYLNSKSVPVRYYDIFGKEHKDITTKTPRQEGRVFEYVDSNPLKPNNMNSFIGFHEIYGTLSALPGRAKPPLQVRVQSGRTYNIFVNSGQFSSCSNCGRDYYSALNRLFPNSFGNVGGGVEPDPVRTERSRPSGHRQRLRSDDFLFGRACFVPATMLPWSHRPHLDIDIQRRRRQLAQHFFFANGLQRDWYGFDYGSVIASFDGLKWFSVGHERQIRAESNVLYLAVNAYFGDLTLGEGYSVRLSQVLGQGPGLGLIKTNTESSGAQCRKYHRCDTDRDCITQLGWDYVCENVRGVKTVWPLFNENSRELEDSAFTANLLNLAGERGAGSNPKRCIYRGRGALCHPSYASQTDPTSTYGGTTLSRINGCSANNWCAQTSSASVFNQKVARFGAPPALQNENEDIRTLLGEGHTFGLAARVIGRPLRYRGRDPLSPGLERTFRDNNIDGLCVPGRDPAVGGGVSYETQHGMSPSASDTSDKGDMVGNMGMTQGQTNVAQVGYYNSCPILDGDGKLYQFEQPSALPNASGEAGRLSVGQNLSTNVFGTFSSDSGIRDLVSDFRPSLIQERPVLQTSRCLRAPGSACFTDWDCAPSSFVRGLFENIDPENGVSLGSNGYEISYWQEELICAQKSEKFSANYDLKKNVCCRETGKELTIGTRDPQDGTFGSLGEINTAQVAGYNDPGAGGISLDDPARNTRTNIVFADTMRDPSLFPSLEVSQNDTCPATATTGRDCGNDHPLGQGQTFSTIASRTCCTGHWVREFHEENGGGHHWLPGKMQSLDKRNFACLNYDLTGLTAMSIQDCLDDTPGGNCDCSDPDNASCAIRSIPLREAGRYNEFFSSLELVGIPQVLIQSNASQYQIDGDPITCTARSTPTDPVNAPIPGTLDSTSDPISDAEFEDEGAGNRFYYKASDQSNFSGTLRKIFSPDKVSCCIPPGSVVSKKTPEKSCCSGKIASINSQQRCCLEDYTNVTVFFNRYISSILKDLPANRFDPLTGRPINQDEVKWLALQKRVCCSGKVSTGKAFSSLRIPTAVGNTSTVRRFVQGDGEEDNLKNEAVLYNLGLRWNTDVYCVP
ncbi:MAG: hypothetical protein OXB88_08175 [Bacteriovoracales bacterium]|nr:hypothetical protein [Bacteriovoracales bacterium]